MKKNQCILLRKNRNSSKQCQFTFANLYELRKTIVEFLHITNLYILSLICPFQVVLIYTIYVQTLFFFCDLATCKATFSLENFVFPLEIVFFLYIKNEESYPIFIHIFTTILLLDSRPPFLSLYNWTVFYISYFFIHLSIENHVLETFAEIIFFVVFGNLIFSISENSKLMRKISLYHLEGLFITIIFGYFQTLAIILSILFLVLIHIALIWKHFEEKWKNYPLNDFYFLKMQVQYGTLCQQCYEKHMQFERQEDSYQIRVCEECAMRIIKKMGICPCCREKCLQQLKYKE